MTKQLDLFDVFSQPDYMIYSEVFPQVDNITLLQELCKNGYLLSENKGRWTIYHLNKNYHNIDDLNNRTSNMDSSKVDTSKVDTSNVDSSNVDSSNMDTSNVDSSNVDSSNMDSSNMDSSKVDTSNMDSSNVDTSNMDSSNMDSSNMDSSNVDSHDVGIKKKIGYDDLSDLIQNICQLEYKTSVEIAQSVNRDEKYLKNDILPRMLKEEKLFKLYAKYHPHQKYISKK